jgi:opacity protein-like surface antigen
VIRSFRIGALVPYLGAGAGVANVAWRMGVAPYGFGPNRIPRLPILDDEADTLALSVIAGFELPLSPRWGFSADYRLQHLPDFSLTGENGEDYDLSHTTHTATLHLSYLFAGQRAPTAVLPQPPGEGWYLGASLGAGFAVDSEVADSIENLDAFRTAPVYSLAVGNAVSPRWRFEIAVERRENDVEVVDFNPETGQFPASGRVTASSLMLNTAYRFRPHKSVRPFLGGGIGPAWMDYHVETRGDVYVDDTATSLAIELMAGLDIALTRRLDFAADIRTWYTDPVKLDRPDGSPFDTWHWVHSLNLGLRYSL